MAGTFAACAPARPGSSWPPWSWATSAPAAATSEKRRVFSPRYCPGHRRRAKPEGYGHPDAPQGAGTDRRGQPQPAPGGGPGVDAPRVRPVDRGPQLRDARRRTVVGRAVDALPDRADGVGGEPPDRGQPAELPPRGGARVRPRERLG